MSNPYKNDPWVVRHKELRKTDPEYDVFVRKNWRRTRKKVDGNLEKSPYIFVGALLIVLGLLSVWVQLYFVQMDADYNVYDAFMGKLGSDLWYDVIGKCVLTIYVLMPAGVLLGGFLLISGLREFLRVSWLLYCTRMVESYRIGEDPVTMETPDRYDPSWL